MATTDKIRIPSYRHHKASGQARVTIDGRDHYLGTFDSPESRAKYKRLVAEYLKTGELQRPLAAASRNPVSYTVAELCRDFLAWARREYRTPDGVETGSVENVRTAMRNLFELFADLQASDFGPRSLVDLREQLASEGLARTTINNRAAVVRRAFKWATREEKIPATVFHGLLSVSGLRRGRGGARETDPVRPAPEDHIEKALPFMPGPVRAMVRLQLLTGARPSEILQMRPVDIERSGNVWIYRPNAHKNSWRGHERGIYLGPQAQAIVLEFLRPGLQERFLFSPTLAEIARRNRMRAKRRTPLYPSHLRALERKRKATPSRKPRDHYDVCSYRQAIRRACGKAKVPAWKPNQLRHNAATRLRAEFGLDVAKAVLGHSRVETTQIYAEADQLRAMQAMARSG